MRRKGDGATKRYRNDLLLVGGILLVGCLLGLVILLRSGSGSRVRVSVAGATVKEFPLRVDAEYRIAGANGGANLLIIRDGEAWIEEASCPDGLCIHMGRINRVGQSVICLPNQVVVEIVGDSTEDTADATTG